MINYIARIDNKIYFFNKNLQDLILNIECSNFYKKNEIIIEETEQEIVPSYNTMNDGIYYIKGTEPINLDELKKNKIQELKDLSEQFKIDNKMYHQLGSYDYENLKECMNGYTEEDYISYRDFINKIVIPQYNEYKKQIIDCTTKEQLDLIIIKFEVQNA